MLYIYIQSVSLVSGLKIRFLNRQFNLVTWLDVFVTYRTCEESQWLEESWAKKEQKKISVKFHWLEKKETSLKNTIKKNK